jgi:hypothetical protein
LAAAVHEDTAEQNRYQIPWVIIRLGSTGFPADQDQNISGVSWITGLYLGTLAGHAEISHASSMDSPSDIVPMMVPSKALCEHSRRGESQALSSSPAFITR